MKSVKTIHVLKLRHRHMWQYCEGLASCPRGTVKSGFYRIFSDADTVLEDTCHLEKLKSPD